jgi:hypothetical protein
MLKLLTFDELGLGTVPCLRRLFAGSWHWSPAFDPRSVLVRFVVDEVTLEQVRLWVPYDGVYPVIIIPPMPHSHSCIIETILTAISRVVNKTLERKWFGLPCKATFVLNSLSFTAVWSVTLALRRYEHAYVQVLRFINCVSLFSGVRSGAVGWGTALQAERSRVPFPMVSLEFLICRILPAALWPWVRLSC